MASPQSVARVLGAFFLFALVLACRAAAPSSVFDTTSATVTFNTYVETSINATTITFAAFDPGAGNQSATNQLLLTNTGNSNAAIDTYLNLSIFVSGANTLANHRLSVAQTSGGTYTSFYGNYTFLNGAGPDLGYYENTAVSGTQAFYFKIYAPAGQTGGSYSGNLTVKSVADGVTP